MDLDFSELNEKDGDYPDEITQLEIRSVLANSKHRLSAIAGFPLKDCYTIACGYSSLKRILLVASMIVDDNNLLKRRILQVKVADEDEIDLYYCKR